MKVHSKARLVLPGLIGALSLVVLASVTNASAADKPVAHHGKTVSSMTARYYDPKTGRVVLTKHYGQKTEGKKIPLPKALRTNGKDDHGTGGVSSASGCVKVTISQSHHGSLGETLFTWKVWTNWCWNRANQTVTINSKDWDIANKSSAWDGSLLKLAGDNGFYDFSADDGHPKSAFKYEAIGKFVGPNLITKVAIYNPDNDLRSYYNGTNQWWTSE